MHTEVPAPTRVGTDRTRIRNIRRRKKRQIMRAIQRIQARQIQQTLVDPTPVARSSQADHSVDELGALARVHVRFGDGGQACQTTVEPVEMVCDPDVFDDLAEPMVATDPDPAPNHPTSEPLSDESEPPLPTNLVFTCVEHGDAIDPEWRQRRRKRPHTVPVYPVELAYDAQQATLLADTATRPGASSHVTVEGHSPTQPPRVEFDQVAQLTRPLRAGDCIAYKMLTMADDFTPRMSDWRVATVLAFDSTTDQVTLVDRPSSPPSGSLNAIDRQSTRLVIDAPDDASFIVDQVDATTGIGTLTTDRTVARVRLLDVRLVPLPI
ncbi:hypothetical protein H4R35_000090 [Dimargaris xerosporica]|nr:hypothetical protein H4R35_000090 [Dimargaris xerosporica]